MLDKRPHYGILKPPQQGGACRGLDRFPPKETAMTRLFFSTLSFVILAGALTAYAADPAPKAKVEIGAQAPAFQIKTQTGKTVDLAELTAKGPVLVRLTCGCSGCDKELAYFQQIHDSYKNQGLTCLFVFREPDAKVAKYAEDKKLNMLYAVDTKGESWNVFQTKTMPTNFLIDKGGKIVSVAAGCDPSGLLANKVAEKAAKVVGTDPVNVKNKVEENKK
jgi:peroxiredoxin